MSQCPNDATYDAGVCHICEVHQRERYERFGYFLPRFLPNLALHGCQLLVMFLVLERASFSMHLAPQSRDEKSAFSHLWDTPSRENPWLD